MAGWYTGMFDDGKQLQIKDQELADHCLRWFCFMARQFQRYAIGFLPLAERSRRFSHFRAGSS